MASTSKPSSSFNARERETHIGKVIENSMAFVEELGSGLLVNPFVRAMRSFLLKGQLTGNKDALSESLSEVFRPRPELLKEYGRVLARNPNTTSTKKRRREPEDEGLGVSCNPSYRLLWSETEIMSPDPNPDPEDALNDGCCALEPPDFIPRPKKEGERERRLNRLEDERFEAEMLVRRLRMAEGNAALLLGRLEGRAAGPVRVDDHLTRRDAACIEELYVKRRYGQGVVARLRSDPRPEILRDVVLRLRNKRVELEKNLLFRLKVR